jgi:hypothetical protein
MINVLINVHKIYTGPLSVQAQYSRLCLISSSFRYNGWEGGLTRMRLNILISSFLQVL